MTDNSERSQTPLASKQRCTCTETCKRMGQPFPADWSWQCQQLPYMQPWRSAVETAGKPTPCWCPHCNQPHSPRVQATDPRNIENPVCTNCGYRKSAHAGNDLDCPHSGPGRKEVFVRTAEKAESRRVAPPKFCAVDECMNRVAPDQEVCDQCAQKAGEKS